MNKYLAKHAFLGKQLDNPPRQDLEMVVVIPTYAEEYLDATLLSLSSCDAPQGSVECIVVINASTQADASVRLLNQKAFDQVETLRDSMPSWMTLQVIVADQLPIKKAGVGLARKIGMDEAVRRFECLSRDGLIINIDADCTCSRDYFTAIASYFDRHPKTWSGCLDFCHKFQDLNGQARSAIVAYELHLRYFIEAQKAIELPFAYQTVGSCMVVRCSAYQKRGGMNTRKAGEDFYFVHKFVSIGRHANIPDAKVYPSARSSDRVPFGTGRAVANFLTSQTQLTSAWRSFRDLEKLVQGLESLYIEPAATMAGLPRSVIAFFSEINGLQELSNIRSHTSSFSTFYQRFYQWFNAFQLMKFVHFCRQFYADKPVLGQAQLLADHLCDDTEAQHVEAEALLTWYRNLA